MAGTTEIPVVR